MSKKMKVFKKLEFGGAILENENGDLFYKPENKRAPLLRVICWDLYPTVKRKDWRKFYNPETDDRFDCNLCLGWIRETQDSKSKVWVYTVENCRHEKGL